MTALTSAGIDIWRSGTAYDDEYSAAYRTEAAGTSSTVTVRVASQDKTNSWAKAGLMLRNNIASAGSSTGYLILATTPGNGIALSSDSNGDGYLDTNTIKTGSATGAPVWLRLVRNGTSVTGSYSADGTTWTTMRHRDPDRGEQHPGRGHVLHSPRRNHRHRDLQPVLRPLTKRFGSRSPKHTPCAGATPHRHTQHRHVRADLSAAWPRAHGIERAAPIPDTSRK